MIDLDPKQALDKILMQAKGAADDASSFSSSARDAMEGMEAMGGDMIKGAIGEVLKMALGGALSGA